MTTYLSLWILLGLLAMLFKIHMFETGYYQSEHRYYEYTNLPNLPSLLACNGHRTTEEEWKKALSSNDHRSSLIVNSEDTEDVVLCPGDYIGDLNSTYLVLRYCNLILYHNGQAIWSSNDLSEGFSSEEDYVCAAALQKDGNFVLYIEIEICTLTEEGGYTSTELEAIWSSETNFNPIRTELEIASQQLHMVQIFEDGSKKLFFSHQSSMKFMENMGPPRQMAGDTFIKNHDDEDQIILRRNEYFGDLNSLHLILRPDCTLVLSNGNTLIWSYTPNFRTRLSCVLNIARSFLAISNIKEKGIYLELEDNEFIMPTPHYLKPSQSEFILEDDQLKVMQIALDGYNLTFSTRPGVNNGLTQNIGSPRQIKLGPYISTSFKIEIMDYLGDLDGLHIILKDDCTLALLNNSNLIWKSKPEDDYVQPIMDCYVPIQYNNHLDLQIRYNHVQNIYYSLDKASSDLPNIRLEPIYIYGGFLLTIGLDDGSIKIYYVDSTTDNKWVEITDIEAFHERKRELIEIRYRQKSDLLQALERCDSIICSFVLSFFE